MKKRVAIIFGGRSGEHEISLRSAQAVVKNIDLEKFDLIPIAIDKNGEWLGPRRSIEYLDESLADNFAADVRDNQCQNVVLNIHTGSKHLVTSDISIIPFDVAFPVLHGTYGEDGTIQGLFEIAGIPYVGCGVLASSSGMDKVVMKALFRDAGLPICRYVWFLRSEWEANSDRVVKLVAEKLGFPSFVKPANLGSSVGISKAENEDELRTAIDLAAKYDRKIIVEECLDMREIECAVIGNEKPEASLPGEYVIKEVSKQFLDYNEKYAGTGNNEFVVPAYVSAELAQKIKDMAVSAYRSIDASGLSRVDFFLRNDNGTLLVNEINTMPGLTDASGFPKMWAGSDLDFTSLITKLIDLAFERNEDISRNITER